MTIKNVTCFGSGLIGSGWATSFVLSGLNTIVYDVEKEKVDKALDNIKYNLKFLYDNGILDDDKFKSCLDKLTLTTDMEEAVANADFIQENGPESYEIKHIIIKNIEKYCKPTAIIASSTSGLLITEIAKFADYPERIIGAHPYNPPHLIPLVELTMGDKTDSNYLDIACSFYKEIHKEPVVLKKEALGFISNRLSLALYREAVDLVENGVCTFEEIDKACCFGPGLRYALMGPNLIYQLGGSNGGIKGILNHIGPTVEKWWEDMATWTKWPEGFSDRVQAGVDEEMKNRIEEHGKTNEEIALFRDKGLIMLLKYHGKL